MTAIAGPDYTTVSSRLMDLPMDLTDPCGTDREHFPAESYRTGVPWLYRLLIERHEEVIRNTER